jgi:putative intracellular protease/amidase
MRHTIRTLISTIILAFSLFPAPGTGVVRPAVQPTESKQVTVAIVLFDGVQIIDYSGPWEVFGQAGFKVYTVADKAETLTTRFDQRVIADYTFDNSPDADILLIPGGRGTLKAADKPRAIMCIHYKQKNARYVMSVCTGAFLLARTGLLDGLSATTYHDAIGNLSQVAPKTKVVYDQRYVDNGKVITTAGLSSGMDGALHLVEKIMGKGQAQFEALVLEYTWEGDAKPARAAFADRYLPAFQALEGKVISIEGDLDHWNMQVLVSKPSSVAEIMDLARKQIASETPHTSSVVTLTQRATRATGRSEIEWKFKDDLGRAWAGFAATEPATEEKDKFNMTLRLTRDKK